MMDEGTIVRAKRAGWNELLLPEEEFDLVPVGEDDGAGPMLGVDLEGELRINRGDVPGVGEVVVYLVGGQEADPLTLVESSDLEAAFNPSQKRDKIGRFGEGGAANLREAKKLAEKVYVKDPRVFADPKIFAAAKNVLAAEVALDKARKEGGGAYGGKEFTAWKTSLSEMRDAEDAMKKAGGWVADDDLPKTTAAALGLNAVPRDTPEHVAALAAFADDATPQQVADVKAWTHKTVRGTPIEVDRIREAEASGKLTRQAKSFNETLDAAPIFEGEVFRGIEVDEQGADFNKLTTVGHSFTMKSSSSSTKLPSKSVAYGNVIMRIKTKTGADISSLEVTKNKEVVLRRGTAYRVTEVHPTLMVSGVRGSTGPNRMTMIDVEER